MQSTTTLILALFCGFLCASAPFVVTAQPAEETPEADASAEASEFYEAALVAFDEENFEKALFELDKAWRLDKNTTYLYQRILVLEAMGKTELALELLESNRESLLETAAVNDLFVVEERLKAAESEAVETNTLPEKKPADPPGRSALNWAGPIALSAVGVGLTIWGITFFGSECLSEVAGECRLEEVPQTGTGIALVSAGAASIVGAVIWFVMTSPDSSRDASGASSRVTFTGDGVVWTF